MGILYSCDNKIGCTFEVWDRTVTLQEWIDNAAKQVADPKWPAGKRYLGDLTSARDEHSITESDLREVSALFGIYRDRIAGVGLAIVVEKEFRKSRIFARFLSLFGVHSTVCARVTTASKWLGIDPHEAATHLQHLRSKMRRRH